MDLTQFSAVRCRCSGGEVGTTLRIVDEMLPMARVGLGKPEIRTSGYQ
jgi:hypothetical protein